MNREFKIYGYYIGLSLLTISLLYIITKPRKKKISNFKRNVVELAKEEHKAWNFGQTKEGSQDTIQRLRNYWQKGTDTKKDDNYYINTPWSSAFISYLMKLAGAGDDFKYSTSHSVYISEAVKNRKENNNKKFKAYKPQEVKVDIGDLVCYPRQEGVTYDSPSGYLSHCDLVVSVKDNIATGIGGNVSNSVSKKQYKLINGKIDKSSNVFVVIKNKK